MVGEDFYKILGVEKNASEKEIKQGYRKKVKMYHPDKNPNNPESEEKFKKVAEAYEVLSDKKKKNRYDTIGHDRYHNSNSNGGYRYSTDEFFNQMQQQQSMMNDKINHSIGKKVVFSMREVFLGLNKTINLTRIEKCEDCHGVGGSEVKICGVCNGHGVENEIINLMGRKFQTQKTCETCIGSGKVFQNKCVKCVGLGGVKVNSNIEIEVPIGIREKSRLEFEGLGSYYRDINGMDSRGDLVIQVEIVDDKFEIYNINDLLSVIKIDYPTLILGGEIKFKTIDESEVLIKINEFTSIGRKLKLNGKGLTTRDGRNRGNQYLQVDLEMPTEISNEERDIIEKLKK